MHSAGDGECLESCEQNFQCEILMKIRAGTRKLCSVLVEGNLALVQLSRKTRGNEILSRK